MKHLTVSLALAFWLLASPAAAQVKPALFVYAGAATADLATTYRFLQYEGRHEVNPLGKFLSDRPATLVAYSAALDAGTVWVLHRTWGRRHPKASAVILYSVAAVRVGLAIRNTRIKPWERMKQ